jgi:hypothetical protein
LSVGLRLLLLLLGDGPRLLALLRVVRRPDCGAGRVRRQLRGRRLRRGRLLLRLRRSRAGRLRALLRADARGRERSQKNRERAEVREAAAIRGMRAEG